MTRCQLLLSLLEDAGERGITTSEILEAGVGSRYGARLHELKRQGHRITSERVREGSWKYTLEPDDPTPFLGGFLGNAADVEVGDGATPETVTGSVADLNAEALKLFESAA